MPGPTAADIEEARRLLYKVLRRLCGLRSAKVMVLPGAPGCRVSVHGSRLRISLGGLGDVDPRGCADSLVEDTVSRGARVLNAVLSLVVGLIGTIAIAGAGLGAAIGVAAILVTIASWLYGRRGRRRIDELLEARRIDGITERLYDDIAGLIGYLLSEATEKCKEARICKIPLSSQYRLRCEQFLARHVYIEA